MKSPLYGYATADPYLLFFVNYLHSICPGKWCKTKLRVSLVFYPTIYKPTLNSNSTWKQWTRSPLYRYATANPYYLFVNYLYSLCPGKWCKSKLRLSLVLYPTIHKPTLHSNSIWKQWTKRPVCVSGTVNPPLFICLLFTLHVSVITGIFSLTLSNYFERLSIFVILVNCVTLGLYDPFDEQCKTQRCQVLDSMEKVIYAFFLAEMLCKWVAMGLFGKMAYFSDSWNRLDCFIVAAG